MFTLDDKEETTLIDPSVRIPLSLCDLQTLGNAIVKVFRTAVTEKEPDRAR